MRKQKKRGTMPVLLAQAKRQNSSQHFLYMQILRLHIKLKTPLEKFGLQAKTK
jgi:hypothetical protein